MATQVQFRRGNTTQTSTFTGAVAEITVDTDKDVVVVHDGTTAGGFPLARESAVTANQIFSQAAFTAANSGGSYANSAFLIANSVAVYSNTVDVTQNTSITAAFTAANSGGSYANSAFLVANGASTVNDTQNTSITAAFTAANSGGSYANSAFLVANGASTVNNTQNTRITYAENHANAAFDFANTISGGSATDNVARSLANTAQVHANFAFNHANSAFTAANGATAVDTTQNNSITAAFTQANSNFVSAVTRLTITNSGSSAYLIDQYTGNNPTIYVSGGETVAFHLNGISGHPFMIRVSSSGSNYDTGLTHVANTGTVSTGSSAQGQVAGTLYWKIPFDIVGSTYVYQCSNHSGMVGSIVIQQPASFVAANTTLAFNQANAAFTVANTDVTNINIENSKTYGNATHSPVVTVTANGRINSISTIAVTATDPSAIAFAIALG